MNFKSYTLPRGISRISILAYALTILVVMLALQPPQSVKALWFFQTLTNQSASTTGRQASPINQEVVATDQAGKAASKGYSQYGSSLMSIAGIKPSSIASILNTVGDTGFKYFNIQDQCRNRAACDLGFMLYKKLSYVHNWLIRLSVSSLTDMSNAYTQSWMDGMMGRNCTTVYLTCRQSPLEGIMNLGLIQQIAS